MAKAKPSLIDELKALPPRSYAKSWPDKLSADAKAEWEAIKQAYRDGLIVCSGKVIAERFFSRFPEAPRINDGHFAKCLKDS